MQLLRTTGGYAGWGDEQLLAIPYARFVQATKVAAETRAQEARDTMTNAAFIGWQFAGVMGGRKVGPFQKYLKGMGLQTPGPSMTSESRQAAIERSRSIVERARAAFSKGAVKA